MELNSIISELKQERDRLMAAIAALERTSQRRSNKARRRHMSDEARARISKAMKLRWAQRKKGTKAFVHEMRKTG